MSTFYTEPTTGTRIATDVIGSDRYQIMKLDIGALGTTIPLTGSLLDDAQLGAGMVVPRFGAMQHIYNAASDTWTRLRSANNLTDNFSGSTAPGTAIAGKNFAGNFDLLREVDAASGTTGRGILSIAPMGFNAGVFQALQLDSSNNLKVNVVNQTIVSGTVSQLNKAVSHGSNPTSGTANVSIQPIANQYGVPFSIGGHPNVQTLRAAYTTAQTGTIVVSGNAQSKIVVTHVLVTVDGNIAITTSIRIGFGVSSTPTTNQVIVSHPGIDGGSGVNVGDGSGILGTGLISDNLLLDCSVPTGGSIEVIITYFTVPS